MILQGRNLTQGLTGADVAALQTELTQLAYTVPPTEQQTSQFGVGTLSAVQAFQAAQNLPVTGTVDTATAAALTNVVATSTYIVTGTVSSPTSASVGVLTVQLVDKNVGGDVNVASTTTGSDGSYKISTMIAPDTLRARHKTSPDFQVRVSAGAAATAQTFLAASSVQYDATTATTLNVSLPPAATGLPSEHDTLTAAIAALYPGSLSQLQESAQQQDITFLANKAGWDARTIAMAALADQFGQITTPAPAPATGAAPPPISLQPAFYYALFRAGLPANADQLFQASPSGVQAIWQQAISQGVIPSSLQSSLTTAVQNFQALSAAHNLTMAPKLGVSTLQALVAPILTSSSQQTQFANLLSQYHDDWSKLWPAVTTAFGAPLTQQLQFAGQLHFLTLNNAPLLAALNRAESQNPLKAPLDLATRGYYDASKWSPLITGSVPPNMPGATPAAQAASYAEFLAAQVRVAFPTCQSGEARRDADRRHQHGRQRGFRFSRQQPGELLDRRRTGSSVHPAGEDHPALGRRDCPDQAAATRLPNDHRRCHHGGVVAA
jgi:Putative peptidoglycan binding domain